MMSPTEIKQAIKVLEQSVAKFKDQLQSNQRAFSETKLYETCLQQTKALEDEVSQYKSQRAEKSQSLDPRAFNTWDNDNYNRVLQSNKQTLSRLEQMVRQTIAGATTGSNDPQELNAQDLKTKQELKIQIEGLITRINTVEREMAEGKRRVNDAKAAIDRLNPSQYAVQNQYFDLFRPLIEKMKAQLKGITDDMTQDKFKDKASYLPTVKLTLTQVDGAVASLERAFSATKTSVDDYLQHVTSEDESYRKFLDGNPTEEELLDEVSNELFLLCRQTGLTPDQVMQFTSQARAEGQRTGQDPTLLFSQYSTLRASRATGATTAEPNANAAQLAQDRMPANAGSRLGNRSAEQPKHSGEHPKYGSSGPSHPKKESKRT